MANATIRKALNSYGLGGLEQEVEAASPHKLICMLFDGALKAIMLARARMHDKDVAAKGEAISKAIAIIEEGLRLSLDKNGPGAEIAANLDNLYEYMSARLLVANLKNDVMALDEVQFLLGQLRDAWATIDKPQQAAAEPAAQAIPRVALSYGRI